MDQRWKNLAAGSRDAANILLREGSWRSAISRAYYAAYYALTDELEQTLPGPYGHERKNNPPHKLLPRYVEQELDKGKYKFGIREKLALIISLLYEARVDADYRPGKNIGMEEATIAVQQMRSIFRRLGHRK